MPRLERVEVLQSWRGAFRGALSRYDLCLKNGAYGLQIGNVFHPFKNQTAVRFQRPDCMVLETRKSDGLQFGAPAEVVKGLMNSKVEAPQTLILTADFVKSGELMNELEFVLYFNVFFKQRKIRIVGSPEQLAAARVILQESFFGPRREEVTRLGDPEKAGYFEKELLHFRNGLAFVLDKMNPGRDKSKLPELDDFIEFVECGIGQSVKLKEGKIAGAGQTEFDTILTQTERGRWIVSEPGEESSTVVDTTLFAPQQKPAEEFAKEKLNPPDFGVTFLGTSHGFDPSKRTTSFVLWVEGKGILVDPLADPKGTLHKYGIEEDQVPFIFLTHVHADHDAGVLRLVLNGKRIKLITSRVIYESFLRKAQAMADASDLKVDLSRYIDFIEATPGETLDGAGFGIPGLSLAISSALHSVPTIRFVAVYNGQNQDSSSVTSQFRSLFYSADTYYDPAALQKMCAAGVLSGSRRDDLLNFGWDSGHIIHEAGIPPIHTPQAVLQAVGRRVHLVHTAKLEEGVTHPLAKEGETLSFVRRQESSHAYESLGQNRILGQISVALASEILRAGRIKTYEQGQTVVQEGSQGESFYFIISGRVRVKRGDQIVAILGDGDYFGEAALLTGKPRNASVQAGTQTTLLEVPSNIFGKIIAQLPAIRSSMEKSSRIRPVLSNVQLLKGLPPKALFDLSIQFQESTYAAGKNIVVQGDPADKFFIITEGKADVIVHDNGERRRIAELSANDVFGEIALIEKDAVRTATVTASAAVKVLWLERGVFARLAEKAPAFHFGITCLAQERRKRTAEAMAAIDPSKPR